MYISCNKLKSHIKENNPIDWIKIWDKFTTHTAEVEGVEKKGFDIDGVVVAEILSVDEVENSKKLHKLTVDNGKEHLQIICAAPNVKVGLKSALVNIGGHVCGFEITKRKLAGLESFGMMCSAEELGFDENCEGIIELPNDYIVGKDIKSYLPIEDIVVEIDNKSLTNRPDLWGHYGIAREVAALTNNELLPLDIAKINNNKKDLSIKIDDNKLCSRYSGLGILNITKKTSPFDMQIFLYYAGMRSISLLVDLTNYLMLELGQPMHAFDGDVVKKIEVSLGDKNTKFTTLDGIERVINEDTLMIKNNNDYFAIAGVMGGQESEIKASTTSIVLESANFDAVSIRKTATRLGLRSEASARYEKSLDPNLTDVAIKRFYYLLKEIDSGVDTSTNLTDVYVNKLNEVEIVLTKEKLNRYMGFEISSNEVIQILQSLSFKVQENDDSYIVTVPTFRATKDISIAEDLIEEITRVYGYDNFKKIPLKLDLNSNSLEETYECQYDIKKYLASKYNAHEVHSYLWYKTAFLNKCNIKKENVKLAGKNEDNILRDDLSLTLLEMCLENFKYNSDFILYEIGTIIKNNENKKSLSIVLADNIINIENCYFKAKEIVENLFKTIKNINVQYESFINEDYYNNDYSLNIIVDKKVLGNINIFNNNIVTKKKCVISININYDMFYELNRKDVVYKEVSKYPFVYLDYTIIANNDLSYDKLDKILQSFKNNYIVSYYLVNRYEDNNIKYTIRYVVNSNEKTLSSEDLQSFKDKFIKHIKSNGLNIVE